MGNITTKEEYHEENNSFMNLLECKESNKLDYQTRELWNDLDLFNMNQSTKVLNIHKDDIYNEDKFKQIFLFDDKLTREYKNCLCFNNPKIVSQTKGVQIINSNAEVLLKVNFDGNEHQKYTITVLEKK